jgi:mono/diheme cytochrome c family protein
MNRFQSLIIVTLLAIGALAALAGTMAQANPHAASTAAPGSPTTLGHRASDPASLERGKVLYIKASCWGCHPHGDNSMNGDKPLKGPSFQKKYPTDEALTQFIRKGNPDYGMPAFPRENLSDNDLKLIIGYIRSLTVSNAK